MSRSSADEDVDGARADIQYVDGGGLEVIICLPGNAEVRRKRVSCWCVWAIKTTSEALDTVHVTSVWQLY